MNRVEVRVFVSPSFLHLVNSPLDVQRVTVDDSGKSVTTWPIGERVDAAAFDPSTQLVFISNGGGNISVFHEDGNDKYSPVETIPTNPGSETLALDTETHNLFVPANMGGQFAVLVFGR